MVIYCRRIGVLGLIASALYAGLFFTTPAASQIMKGGSAIQPPPKPAKASDGTTSASQFSGIKLHEDAQFRQYLNVARDCIKDKAWQDAVTALQIILDNKEDFYAQVSEIDPSGKKTQRWTSVKFEANNLLGSMATEGLDVYEQRFGAAARNQLATAKTTGNREVLAEVAQRFLHTKAGIEANDLLATYYMDRGQFFMAALRFEKLLAMNPDRIKIDDMTLFKTALSYRRAGDAKKGDAIWLKLEPRLREHGGLKIGSDLVATVKVREVLDQAPRAESANQFDWPYVRGNVTNSARAQGSPPLLDVTLFTRQTIKEKAEDNDDDEPDKGSEKGTETLNLINKAVSHQGGMSNTPVLPGFFPIATNNLLVYRSYYDVRAVYIQDEKDTAGKIVNKAGSFAWKTTGFGGALVSVRAGKYQPTIERWLNHFGNSAYSSLIYENTLIGTLATDHRYFYAIDDLAVPAPTNEFLSGIWNSGQIVQDVKPLVLQNTLRAFSLREGEGRCVWELGGGVKNDAFSDSHFLGVPIAVGGKLYALNEKNSGPSSDSELRLVCIEPNKIVEGSAPKRPVVVEPIQSLGMVAQQSRVTHDMYRRLNAVHLAYGEGILVCPTNAGEILGVEILSRSLAWAYSYREQMPTLAPAVPFQARPFQVQMSSAVPNPPKWHSAPPVIQDGKVVFTAPDADSIHCINLRDGTLNWKKKHTDNDLYLAGVYGGKVLIVGKSAVRALSLEDGRQLWYVPTGDLPSGQGVASKNIYYLPLKKGEIMALDIDKGQVKAHNRAKRGGAAPGNLVFYEGTVISQTPTQIVAYPQLAARLQLAHANLQADPDNPTRLVERGELLLADGQVPKAVDDLEKALARRPDEPLNSRARLKLYDALTDLLTADFTGAGSRYLDEYRELCQVPGNETEQQQRQSRYYRIVGQGREAQGNLVEAFQMYREFGALSIHRDQGGIASLDDPTHKVPANVWLRGRVSAMIAKATPEQRAPLEKKIAAEWKVVDAKKDVAAIRSFVGMFDVPFAVGREARLRLAEIILAKNDRPSFLEAELNLQQLRGPAYKSDPESGGRALAALAQLEEKKGSASSMKLAAAYYRQLEHEFGKASVGAFGKGTGTDLYNGLASDPRFWPYLEEPSSPWGNDKIAAREIAAGNMSGMKEVIFQPEGDLTPAMKQFRLVLDPKNISSPQLRLLDMAANNVLWAQTLPSVPQNSQYFYLLSQQIQANNPYAPNAKFHFFQAKGSLIVFQVGFVVYCLDADHGKILWQQSLFEQPPLPGTMMFQLLPDQDGYLDSVIWNQNQRSRTPIGHVGAVEASYVALITQKGLLVLDPILGTVLWKKLDVASGTRVFGDENYLYLVETSEGSVGSGRILRASDGMEISAPDFGAIYQHRLKVLGRRIVAALPEKGSLVLKLYDVPSGKDIWSKAFDPKAVVLQTEDADLTGVIDQAGHLTVLDVDTGREVLGASVIQGRITVADLKELKDPMLLRDADHYYVALNKPVDAAKVAGGFLVNNFSNGLRCATVNGWFVALHRQDGQKQAGDKTLSWKKGEVHWHSYSPLVNQMIVLEQFDQLPIILFSARHGELTNGGAGARWLTFTQSIDKWTGKVIFDPGARPSNSSPLFSSLTVDRMNGTINLIGLQSNTLQHYIDDGRKPSEIPGLVAGNPQGPAAINNAYVPLQLFEMQGNAPVLLPFNGLRPVPIPILPAQKK